MTSRKRYIGDSVYADYDGHMLVLTTENGLGPSNTIHLEPQVLEALFLYVEKTYGVKVTVTKAEL